VEEVGRDHDFDWAVIEPSSYRSIIQLAGRILRHRDQVPDAANLLLLQRNYKALNKRKICFSRPGFESNNLKLDSHDLFDNLDEEQYRAITAIQRIQLPKGFRVKGEKYVNLVELEHQALKEQLFSGNRPAKAWWKNNTHWCGEVQRQQRFRDSQKDEAYYLWLDSPYREPYWKWKNEQVSPPEFGDQSIISNEEENLKIAEGNSFWFDLNASTVYRQLADDMELAISEISQKFGEVRLTEYENHSAEYYYHPQLGVYQQIGS
jgi:CRISPR-associated endonuclease/helicase Cas3